MIDFRDSGTGATSEVTPPTQTQTWVTLGAAVAVGFGGVLLGVTAGWYLRGNHETKRLSRRDQRQLRGEER